MRYHDPNDHTMKQFFDRGQEIHYKKGEIILRPKETPAGVFFVIAGFIKVYSISEDGSRQLLIIHKSQEVFPLPWALNDEVPVNLYYQAMTPVTLRRVSRTMLSLSMQNNPRLSQALVRQFANTLSIYDSTLGSLMQRKASHRIVCRLLLMSDRFGLFSNGDIILNVPVSHQDIADSVNVSRETVSREIERLAREGVLEQRNSIIIIKDKRALQRYIDDRL